MLSSIKRWPTDAPRPDERALTRELELEGLEPELRVIQNAGPSGDERALLRETWWLLRGTVRVEEPDGETARLKPGDRIDLAPGARVTFLPEEQGAVFVFAKGSGGWI